MAYARASTRHVPGSCGRSPSIRWVGWFPGVTGTSVLGPGHGTKLVRRRRAQAEELQIGRDLLVEHVLADLDGAAPGQRRLDERGPLPAHDGLSDEGRRHEPSDVDGQGV